MSYYGWRPYVSAAARRAKAAREMGKLRKKGHPVSPVVIEGRSIARTFWGKAWCDNLERYSDFMNRLPRGRTYVRNGSVVDLQIAQGEVTALVIGSEIYRVSVQVTSVPKKRYKALCAECAGAIDSLVELLQGRFSKAVMERICRERTGLFPAPEEIKFSCSCPDWAYMCKHVAAVLYGIGARLDTQPEVLFTLRKVDEKELIAKAGEGLTLPTTAPASDKVLADEGLSELFGVDLAEQTPAPARESPSAKAARHRRAEFVSTTQPDADLKISEKAAKAKGKSARKITKAAALNSKEKKRIEDKRKDRAETERGSRSKAKGWRSADSLKKTSESRKKPAVKK